MTAIRTDVREEILGSEPGSLWAKFRQPGGFRALLRLVAAAGWTILLFPVLVAGMALSSARAAWRRRARNGVVRLWARGLARIAGMRIQVRGTPPEPPFFLVANHVSYVDILLLLATTKTTVFVAKRELADWPFLGYLTRLVGTIYLNRASRRDARRAITAIEYCTAQGDGAIAFPEGTSSDGATVYPMKAALFEWAAEQERQVRTATLYYQTRPNAPPARTAVCWWGSATFLPHLIDLCRLQGFAGTVHFHPEPVVGGDRTELASRARARIAEHFVPHHDSQSQPESVRYVHSSP
ncbi:MAG: lysophospholipid acyltransferase family protein [Gemmatimonadales bacterium]